MTQLQRKTIIKGLLFFAQHANTGVIINQELSLATLSNTFRYSSISLDPVSVISLFFPSNVITGTASISLLTSFNLVCTSSSPNSLSNTTLFASSSEMPASMQDVIKTSSSEGCSPCSKYRV